MVSRVSTKAYPALQLRCEDKGVRRWDLVFRKAVGNMRDTNAGKLTPTWEGAYRVIAIVGAGAYYLEDLDERPLPRPWNVHNLKKFYQ